MPAKTGLTVCPVCERSIDRKLGSFTMFFGVWYHKTCGDFARTFHRVLAAEYEWHKNHEGLSGCSDSYERGFRVGLLQAKRLFRRTLFTRKDK